MHGLPKDRGSIITSDVFQTTNKVAAHLCISQYAGHGNKRRYLSSEFLLNYPEHCMYVQSGLYPKEVKICTKCRFYYDYLRAKFNDVFGIPN